MLKQYVRGRVYVFIDAENLFYSQRTLGWLVSYEELLRYLKDEFGKETRIFVYTGREDGNERQAKFIRLIGRLGYSVRSKVVKKIRTSDGYKWKNNLDLELALEAFDLCDDYDTMVLVSGDSDFAILLDYLKKYNKQRIVISTRRHVSLELLQRAKYVELKRLRSFIAQR